MRIFKSIVIQKKKEISENEEIKKGLFHICMVLRE